MADSISDAISDVKFVSDNFDLFLCLAHFLRDVRLLLVSFTAEVLKYHDVP